MAEMLSFTKSYFGATEAINENKRCDLHLTHIQRAWISLPSARSIHKHAHTRASVASISLGHTLIRKAAVLANVSVVTGEENRTEQSRTSAIMLQRVRLSVCVCV